MSKVYPGQVVAVCHLCSESYVTWPSLLKRGRRFCSHSCAATHINNERVASRNWEVDWTHPANYGGKFWARNASSHIPAARDWHLTSGATLRAAGINTPTYRKDSWEVDWLKRQGKRVWARNPMSKMPEAREWHWTTVTTLQQAGVRWRPVTEHDGRHFSPQGYVYLTPSGMTEEEVRLVDEHDLWGGKKRTRVLEHRLVALKKYGSLGRDEVVRHMNGQKSDNRPENLVRGTTQENTMDHNTARLMAMYWHQKYEQAVRELNELRNLV